MQRSHKKRCKKKDLCTNKYVGPSKPDGNRRRARYFRAYRSERNMLCTIENTFLIEHDRRNYRACRFIYYVVIPLLARYLWFPPDRERLINVEDDVYNQILSYRFQRGTKKEPYRVTVWRFRSPTLEESQKQQKL